MDIEEVIKNSNITEKLMNDARKEGYNQALEDFKKEFIKRFGCMSFRARDVIWELKKSEVEEDGI